MAPPSLLPLLPLLLFAGGCGVTGSPEAVGKLVVSRRTPMSTVPPGMVTLTVMSLLIAGTPEMVKDPSAF